VKDRFSLFFGLKFWVRVCPLNPEPKVISEK